MSEYPVSIAGFEARWFADKRYNLTLHDQGKRFAEVYWWGGDELEVVEIMIDPDHRGQGIGPQIYEALISATGLDLKWQRTALASPEMMKLAVSFCKKYNVDLPDDWDFVTVPAINVIDC